MRAQAGKRGWTGLHLRPGNGVRLLALPRASLRKSRHKSQWRAPVLGRISREARPDARVSCFGRTDALNDRGLLRSARTLEAFLRNAKVRLGTTIGPRSVPRALLAPEAVLGFLWSLESRDLERADRLTRTRTSAGWRRWLSGERGVALIVSASFDAVDLAGRYLHPPREHDGPDATRADQVLKRSPAINPEPASCFAL